MDAVQEQEDAAARPAAARGPGRPLRYRLFQLAASGLLPLALVATAVIAWLVEDRRDEAQRSALEVSRALATAVDAELRSTMSALQTLGLSDELQPAQLEAFQALARRVAERHGWRSVLLADNTGRVLMSSALQLGSTAPQLVDAESMARAVTSRQPVVGRVAEGPNGHGAAFAVRVPILLGDEVRYVLSAVIPAEHVLTVVTRQGVAPSWLVSIYDQAGMRVARSRDHASATPSPSLLAMLNSGQLQGSGTTTTLEGAAAYTGYTRLQDSGWVVAAGVLASEANRAVYPLLAAVAGGLLASLALSAFLAWLLARRVSQPIDVLKSAAVALGTGDRVELQPLGVAELDQVATALKQAGAERDRAARERREAEAEREALLARVTEALRMAEDAGRSKDEFLAMLGHELRNPLAPIATAMHLMERRGDDTTRSERAVVQRQLAHMTRLVDDLLDVARITGKRMAMHFEPMRLETLLDKAAETVRPLLGERSLEIAASAPARDAWLSADEVRLGQVLNNLLGNAIKFTGPQGRIVVRAWREKDRVHIQVRDDGLGMTPEVVQHVFDTFYQAPQASDRPLGGLGLGLAIARSLAEMHGGTVEAASEGPGKGSCFTVRLPVIDAPAAAEEPAQAQPAQATAGRVLVVDDNQDAADTAAALLQLSGYSVATAYEPEAALATFDSFEPDVALLDIGLPGMNGYELAAQLRAHKRGGRCRLVALTGYGTQADVARAMQAGFDAHLTKPAAPDALLETVDKMLA